MYDQRHGGPYDRGQADAYYDRSYNPHFFTGATHQSTLVELQDMSVEEIVAYTAGFRDSE